MLSVFFSNAVKIKGISKIMIRLSALKLKLLLKVLV